MTSHSHAVSYENGTARLKDIGLSELGRFVFAPGGLEDMTFQQGGDQLPLPPFIYRQTRILSPRLLCLLRSDNEEDVCYTRLHPHQDISPCSTSQISRIRFLHSTA